MNLIPALPTTYALDRPVFANVISMTLGMSSALKSPYFEVRGCDVEGMSLGEPKHIYKWSFYYNYSN